MTFEGLGNMAFLKIPRPDELEEAEEADEPVDEKEREEKAGTMLR